MLGDMENPDDHGWLYRRGSWDSGVPAPRFESACSSGSWAIATASVWVASGFFDGRARCWRRKSVLASTLIIA
jgi:hypothetical protein